MASLEVAPDRLTVRLSFAERLMAFHGNIVVPRDALQGAEVVDDPFRSIRGIRAPGSAIPFVGAYGTFRHKGKKAFVAVHRGERAVRLSLAGQKFESIVLGVADPEQLVAKL